MRCAKGFKCTAVLGIGKEGRGGIGSSSRTGGTARELAVSLFRNACKLNAVLAQEAKVDMLARISIVSSSVVWVLLSVPRDGHLRIMRLSKSTFRSRSEEVVWRSSADHWLAGSRTWVKLQAGMRVSHERVRGQIHSQGILQMLIDLHNRCLITASVTVIGRTEYCDDVPILTPVVALHDKLVSSCD